jgi:hypothetical protein
VIPVAKNYKISYVVIGGDHPGAILNAEEKPQTGDEVRFGDKLFHVVEVINLMPPRGEFHYLHVTLKPAST